MRDLIRRCGIFLLAMAVYLPAHAWSGPGHAAVAVFAYRQLPADLQARYVEILRHHPNFAGWQQDYDKVKASLPSNLDFGTYVFVRASTWPDEIRNKHVSPFDHPNWHFIDYPVQQADFSTGPAPTPDDDVLFGIKEAERVLGDATATPEAQAAHLSWLIHLVGDIHQPLHCATLINATTYPPPGGDRGGNSFFVRAKAKAKAINLHSFWDQQLGSAFQPKPATALKDAIQLASEHPRASLAQLGTAADPPAWSRESLAAAIGHAYQYQQGAQGATSLARLPGGADAGHAPALPAGYSQQAKQVARERISLAGYRLADTLQSLAAPAPPPPPPAPAATGTGSTGSAAPSPGRPR